jgi:hypothetical protein
VRGHVRPTLAKIVGAGKKTAASFCAQTPLGLSFMPAEERVMVNPETTMRSPYARLASLVLGALLLAGCGQWSWNPVRWFDKEPDGKTPVVDVIEIESGTSNPGEERF